MEPCYGETLVAAIAANSAGRSQGVVGITNGRTAYGPYAGTYCFDLTSAPAVVVASAEITDLGTEVWDIVVQST